MFRNQYDTDVITFSPAGRLHQVEYAMEAVKQGAATVGIRGREYAVVGSLKRSTSELAAYQQKIFQIDSHLGIAVSGIIGDARALASLMRSECLSWRYTYDSNMPTVRLVTKVADKSQWYTQRGDKRPYGVGLLVASHDSDGPHLYNTEPSGLFNEWRAYAIGARSQSAKTYLEKFADDFNTCDRDSLIRHALSALKGASQKKLTSRNIAIGIVGPDHDFRILENEDIRPFVAQVNNDDNDDDEDDKDAPKTAMDEEEEEKESSSSASSSSSSSSSSQAAEEEKPDDSDMPRD